MRIVERAYLIGRGATHIIEIVLGLRALWSSIDLPISLLVIVAFEHDSETREEDGENEMVHLRWLVVASALITTKAEADGTRNARAVLFATIKCIAAAGP